MNRIQVITTPEGPITIIAPVAQQLLKAGIISGTLDGGLHATDAATVKAAVMAHKPVTHWCDWDEPGERSVRTLCRVFIARREAVTQPTCPICARVLVERQRVADACGDGTPFDD